MDVAEGSTAGEAATRIRAYFLWEVAGQPDGRAEEFWFEALDVTASSAEEDHLIDKASKVKAVSASFVASWFTPGHLVTTLVRRFTRFSLRPPLVAALWR